MSTHSYICSHSIDTVGAVIYINEFLDLNRGFCSVYFLLCLMRRIRSEGEVQIESKQKCNACCCFCYLAGSETNISIIDLFQAAKRH